MQTEQMDRQTDRANRGETFLNFPSYHASEKTTGITSGKRKKGLINEIIFNAGYGKILSKKRN